MSSFVDSSFGGGGWRWYGRMSCDGRDRCPALERPVAAGSDRTVLGGGCGHGCQSGCRSARERNAKPAAVPVELQMSAVNRMLNFEITHDPHYQGLELQVFDDPAHGRGMAVLLRRRDDGRMDIYRQPGLALEPEMAQVGGELGEWRESPIDPARFKICPDGVDLDVGFTDVAGRSRCASTTGTTGHGTGRRCPHRWGRSLRARPHCRCSSWGAATWCAGSAAPSTSASTVVRSRPAGYPSAGCTGAGWSSTPPSPPWSSAPGHDGLVATVDPQAPGDVEVDPRSGGTAALRARNGGHRARLELAPALHVARLRPRQTIEGTRRLGIDSDPAVVGGFWTAERRQDVVELVLDVVRGWRPTGLPPLMAAVTRLAPVFRTWPTTYRWTGTVILGNQPILTRRWGAKEIGGTSPTGGSRARVRGSRQARKPGRAPSPRDGSR
jgi:hypothetical protein